MLVWAIYINIYFYKTVLKSSKAIEQLHQSVLSGGSYRLMRKLHLADCNP